MSRGMDLLWLAWALFTGQINGNKWIKSSFCYQKIKKMDIGTALDKQIIMIPVSFMMLKSLKCFMFLCNIHYQNTNMNLLVLLISQS